METETEPEDECKLRFQMELEFVQCLANPWYLLFLAQQQYFQDDSFLNYLKYLRYWKQPQYIKYIQYPHCLYFLDLFDQEEFRAAVANNDVITFIHQKQFYHWQYRSRFLSKALSHKNHDNPQANLVAKQ